MVDSEFDPFDLVTCEVYGTFFGTLIANLDQIRFSPLSIERYGVPAHALNNALRAEVAWYISRVKQGCSIRVRMFIDGDENACRYYSRIYERVSGEVMPRAGMYRIQNGSWEVYPRSRGQLLDSLFPWGSEIEILDSKFDRIVNLSDSRDYDCIMIEPLSNFVRIAVEVVALNYGFRVLKDRLEFFDVPEDEKYEVEIDADRLVPNIREQSPEYLKMRER